MTGEGLISLAGIALSLLFSFTPKLRTWYGRLDGDQKRVLMGVSLLAVTVIIFSAGCAGVRISSTPPFVFDDPSARANCSRAGLLELMGQFVIALTLGAAANQGTFLLTPKGRKPSSVIPSATRPQWAFYNHATHKDRSE